MTDEMRWSCFFKSKAEALLMSRYYNRLLSYYYSKWSSLVFSTILHGHYLICHSTTWRATRNTIEAIKQTIRVTHTPNSTNKEERTKALKNWTKNKHCFLHGEEAWLLGDDDFLMSFEKTAKKNRSLISEWNISERKKNPRRFQSRRLTLFPLDYLLKNLNLYCVPFSLCSLSSAEAS